MDPEKKEPPQRDAGSPDDFGKVIDTLHTKQKLPSLRTYQGDVAEFIREKNESVTSITLKEKKRREEQVADLDIPVSKNNNEPGNFRVNFVMLALSLILIAGGLVTYFYLFQYSKNTQPTPVVVEEKTIIPGNKTFSITNIDKENLTAALAKLKAVDGLNVVKLSDTTNKEIKTAQEFLTLLKINQSLPIERALLEDFLIGVFVKNELRSNFLILTTNNFDLAFGEMLNWESNMPNDLSFLIEQNQTNQSAPVASTTATSTVKLPLKLDFFEWRDLIVKNKDTRALVNEKREAKIAYAFLNKNTILITNDLKAIGEIANLYVSQNVAR